MFTQIQFLNFVKDVTMYPDMQELLLASDLFITDYSSCIFDFALMRKPAFLYASDYEEYQKEQGTYFDIRRDLPFSFAETTDMLIENIYDFSNEEYQSKLEKYFMNEKIGLKDVGTASNFVAELIKNKMKIG